MVSSQVGGVLMNQAEMVGQLCRAFGWEIKKSRVEAGLNAFFELIQTRAQMSQATYVKHVGRWDVRLCKARRRRNPRTGAVCVSPAYFKVVFRPSRGLVASLN